MSLGEWLQAGVALLLAGVGAAAVFVAVWVS